MINDKADVKASWTHVRANAITTMAGNWPVKHEEKKHGFGAT